MNTSGTTASSWNVKSSANTTDGGSVGDNVTKKTNYLILGNNDFCQSIKDGKSNKQKKAEDLILKGHDIEILSENVFYDLVLEG